MRVGLILMASGAGRRFGGNKLLRKVEGKTLAERAMDACPPRLFSPAAVVSCYPELLALAEARGYLACENPGAGEGVSASIRVGLEHMGDADGALFAVCDQPWLTRASVERLLFAFEGRPDSICALSWGGKKGNPCLFPRRFFPELSALFGDTGGGAVIRAHPKSLFLVEALSQVELRDVDAPSDL